MIYKVALSITLLCLATLFAVSGGWLTGDVSIIYKVGVISSIVAVVALLIGK